MSTLRTFNLQNPDSGTVNIEMDQGGNTLMTGIATVRGAAHFTSTSGSDAVGIGTDITAYKLDVRVTGAEAGLRVYNPDTSSNASGMIRLGNDDNQNAAFLRLNGSNNTSAVGGAGSLVLGHGLSKDLHLSTAGVSRLKITSAGYIGINETSPDTYLHVKTGTDSALVKLEQTATNGRAQVQYLNPHGDWIQGIQGATNTGDYLIYTSQAKNLTFYTSGTLRQKIQSDGKVILGGNANQSANRDLSVVAPPGNSNEAQIGLQPTNSSGNYNPEVFISAIADGTYGAHMYFKTRDTSGNRLERLRITSAGNIGIGEGTPLGKLHIKTGDSGASSVGASADELVIEGSGHAGMTILSGANQQALINFADPDDVNVGGFTYTHSDNSLVFRVNDAEKLRITSSGAHNLSSPSSSVAAGLLNVPNGSRLSSGATPRGTYATGNGGVVDMARYEMISMCITSFPANNNAICAINGAPLYINDSRDTWDRYYALPNYLLGTLTHDCINNSSFNITLACTMTVFMGRSSTWNSVSTSGWNLIESNTSIGPFSGNSRLYVRTLAAGTHSLDNDSAMYFFSL